MRNWRKQGTSLACLVAGMWLTACSGARTPAETESESPAEEQPVPAQVVGEIASVHPAEGFVLIKRLGRASFGPEMLYSSMNQNGATASLRPTGEKLGRFYAADVIEGEPRQGDFVIARRMPKEGRPEMTPVPETDQNRPPRGWPGVDFEP